MNHRKHSRTSLDDIRKCLARGMSLKQTAAELDCSLQGLRQAYSLLEDLQDVPRTQALCAHDPFGILRAGGLSQRRD